MSLSLATHSVAERLKSDTYAQHRRSEDLLMPALHGIATRSDYAAVLRTFYGFFHPVQALIAPQITNDILPDAGQRRHADLILADLAALGFPVDGLPLCRELPAIHNQAEALGALYVLEGSTLGGRVIAKMLMKNEALALGDEHLHFFHGYGEETGSKWKSFVQVLNAQTHDIDPIARSADETFARFAAWIEKTLLHESNA